MPLVTREAVEIARTGAWNTSTGKWNCTRSQLADAVRAAKSGRFRNPVLKRGHVDPRFAGDAIVAEDGEPALGQVRNLRLADDGDSLVGDLLVPDWLDDELPATYPSRSVEADLGVETVDGEKFELVVSGLALLGVTKPAIQSLAEIPERIAASEFTAAMSIAAGFFDEAAHPRGGKGTSAGGKFVAKGDGYKGKEDQADDVKAVQKELIRLGFLSADSGKNGGNDGLFGPKTEAAVKKWQREHGHAETGKVSESLLKTLKAAKVGDKGEAQKKVDSGAKTAAEKRAEKKTPARKAPRMLSTRQKKVNAAAAAATPEGLDIREITADTVVYDDEDGRVWAAAWEDVDGEIVVHEAAPAVARYETIAASAAGMAAHSMFLGIGSARGWGSGIITASLGDTSVSIAPAVREALGMSETDTEDAVNAALLARLQAPEAPTTNTQENPVVTDPAVPAAQVSNETLTTSTSVVDVETMVAAKVAAALAPIQASAAQYEAKISDLSTELAQRKADEAAATKAQILASALTDGKILPADQEQWSADYDESPKVTTRILASLKPGTAFPVAAAGYAGEDAKALDEFKSFEAAFNWGADSNG